MEVGQHKRQDDTRPPVTEQTLTEQTVTEQNRNR